MRHTVAACCLALLACGGDAGGPSVPDPVGTWHLVTLNDDPLPVRFGTAETFTDILADTITLVDGAGSRWRTRVRDSTTVPGACCNQTFTTSTDLVWTQDGPSLTLTSLFPAGAVEHPATLIEDTLRLQLTRGGVLPNGLYVYGR